MKTMRFGLDVPHLDEHGQMSVPQLEQLDSLDHHDESRSGALLQAAITEAFALLNAGARQEAIAQIKQYADLAARSNAYPLTYIVFKGVSANMLQSCRIHPRSDFSAAASSAQSSPRGNRWP